MSARTLPPPLPPVCLTRTYLSRGVKGGTVIAEDVLDPEIHRRRLLDPDAYRQQVSPCRRCGGAILHAHCFRQRQLRPARSESEPTVVVAIRLYRCASRSCGAVFTVLPAFVARHLWRAWETVTAVTRRGLPAPKTTKRRWLARLSSDARQLVETFTSAAEQRVRDVLSKAHAPTRHDFLDALEPVVGRPLLALVAAWIHRLSAGLRLM